MTPAGAARACRVREIKGRSRRRGDIRGVQRLARTAVGRRRHSRRHPLRGVLRRLLTASRIGQLGRFSVLPGVRTRLDGRRSDALAVLLLLLLLLFAVNAKRLVAGGNHRRVHLSISRKVHHQLWYAER